MKIKVLLVGWVFIAANSFNVSFADIIYLNNGKQMDGVITGETDNSIELDLGFGKTSVKKTKIKSIERSDENEKEQLLEDWQVKAQIRQEQVKKLKEREKTEEKIQRVKRRTKKEVIEMPNKAFIKYIQRKNAIGVEALLDKKFRAYLLVDTGATTTLLSKKTAKALGISVLHGKIVNMQVADGRIVKAVRVYLKSISVAGMEVKDVAASVLINDEDDGVWDGLLGMSYLENFIFRVDAGEKQLILEKKIEK